MTILISDSFDRANSTTTLGTTNSYNGGTGKLWAVSGQGAYGILNNTAYIATQAGSGHNAAYVDVGVSDFIVTATLAAIGSGESPKLVIRMQDSENMLMLDANISNGYSFYKYISGAGTALSSFALLPKNGDVIKVTANGSTITAYVNGVQAIQSTITDYQASTKTGLSAYKYPNTRFDNFIVEDFSTGTPTGTPGSQAYQTKQTLCSTSSLAPLLKQVLYKQGSQDYQTKQVISSSGVPGSLALATKQTLYAQGSQNYLTQQNITAVAPQGTPGSRLFTTKQSLYQTNSTNFATKQQIFATFSKDFATLIVIDTVKPTFGSIDFSVKVVIHNMFVIQHDLTGEKFMFPHMNIAKETYEGFEFYQAVPVGFSVALDQTPVPLYYMSNGEQTNTVRWEANSADPLKTMNKWEND